jgi:hypothetical protein
MSYILPSPVACHWRSSTSPIFAEAYEHAKHYVGWCGRDDLRLRMNEHVSGPGSRSGRGEERRLRDMHRLLDLVAKRARLTAGELRSNVFRHTYCAARPQTLDRGRR